MAPSLTKADTDQGSVFTGCNADAVAATAFDTILKGVVSAEMVSKYTAVQASLEMLMTQIAAIVHNSHPDRVPDLIATTISKTMKPVIVKLIAAGVAESRANKEAWDRVAVPAPATSALLSDFRRILLDGDVKGRMELLGRADAPVDLLAAAIEVAGMLQLPESFLEEIQRRYVIANAIETHSLTADAGLTPAPDHPFQHGVNRAKVTELAEKMITAHQAKLDALDTIEAATSRLVIMLAVVSGRSVGDIWTLVTGK